MAFFVLFCVYVCVFVRTRAPIPPSQMPYLLNQIQILPPQDLTLSSRFLLIP